MALPRNQYAVQEFPAQGADGAFADGVHPRSLDGRAHDPGARGLENGVERGSDVRSAIADQEPDVLEPLTEGQSEVAGLLHCPVPRGVRGDAAQMHSAATVLDEHQHVHALEQHGVHVQEINREDPGSLRCQELPPRRAGPARRRIDARSTQDLPHRGWRDRHAELRKLALNPAVPPQRILPCPPNDQPGDARDRRRAAGLRRLLMSYLRPASLRWQARSVAGVTGEDPVQCLRSRSHATAANHARRPARPYPAGMPAQHRLVVSEHEQFGVFRAVAAEHQDGQAEYPARQQVDDLEQHPASQPPLRPSRRQQSKVTHPIE